MMKLKTQITCLMAAASIAITPAWAGSVGGFGGSTEITQIQNNLQLIMSYEKQVEGYIRQGLQLQNEITNLIKNPMSILGPEVGQMINSIGKIWSGGQSIGYNLAQIDKNFATMFKSSKAGDFAQMFTKWHSTNTDTLQSLLRAVGTQRENYSSDQAAVSDLYNRSQNTSGNLDTLQTLSQINIRQIQELQSLRELMASQAQASATYMATQNAKDESKDQVNADLQRLLSQRSRPNWDGPSQKFDRFNFYK
ncbi:conjugative transfer protein TrbJ [Comamonas thiooxydans]|uniref:Conjugative transfer protein TrbJ n=2 Tax=Comamonas thiooxydans TaxID=363952 RepID=A0A0E3BQ83_9BURK|nr:conjugative transfer protein TrbJ [Comamonas thiooxydans]